MYILICNLYLCSIKVLSLSLSLSLSLIDVADTGQYDKDLVMFVPNDRTIGIQERHPVIMSSFDR